MKTIYLSGHNNFGNRGCEALVRTTVGLLHEHLGDVTVLVPSLDIKRDAKQWPEAGANGVEFVEAGLPPKTWTYWDRLCRRIPAFTHLPMPALAPSSTLQACLDRSDALLVIGGDNYSLDYDLASLAYFMGEVEAAMKRNIPTLLWGASVGPFSRLPGIERQMIAHLRRMARITVREPASIEYLKSVGVADNVMPVTDPAFLLQPQPFPTEHLFDNAAGVLGLNLSPLVQRQLTRLGRPAALLKETTSFIRSAVQTYGLNILLVPHVVPLNQIGFGNDEHTHRQIKEALPELGDKVMLAPSGLNTAQTKYLISKCRYFVGARTHATIAAMSSCVPVLSIAYSVKARGINRDLFGHERYMLPVEAMTSDTLRDGLNLLVSEESSIRALFAHQVSTYKSRAHDSARWLGQHLLERSLS